MLLPFELLEQIFCCLSIPDLDAARLTYRTWWSRIMASRTIQLSALGKDASFSTRELTADLLQHIHILIDGAPVFVWLI